MNLHHLRHTPWWPVLALQWQLAQHLRQVHTTQAHDSAARIAYHRAAQQAITTMVKQIQILTGIPAEDARRIIDNLQQQDSTNHRPVPPHSITWRLDYTNREGVTFTAADQQAHSPVTFPSDDDLGMDRTTLAADFLRHELGTTVHSHTGCFTSPHPTESSQYAGFHYVLCAELVGWTEEEITKIRAHLAHV